MKAKSQGKRKVTTISIVDGVQQAEIVQYRTVYQDKVGRFYVNHYLGGKVEVTQRLDGSFSKIARFTSLKVASS